MQSSFKEHFQLIVFQKLSDRRLEKSYMRKHTCHHDHHQRSRYVTIGLERKFHWSLQLINNQKEKLFDSHKKKLPDEQNSSNQPNQSRSQIVIDQGNLITRKTCLLLKVKRPVLKRSMWNLFTKNSVLQIDQGNLISRKTWLVFKHVRLKRIRMLELNKLMIDQGNLINAAMQIDTLSNETYNKVNHLIPSVKNQNEWFMKLGTSNCAKYSIWNPKRSAKYVYHTGTSASSNARAVTSCEKVQRRIRNSSSTRWTSFLFLITT